MPATRLPYTSIKHTTVTGSLHHLGRPDVSAMQHPDVEARQLLRARKKRSRTSCYPCRTRKVNCDKCSPCSRCLKSGYPDLCSLEGPQEQGLAQATPLSVTATATATAIPPLVSSTTVPSAGESQRWSQDQHAQSGPSIDLRSPMHTSTHGIRQIDSAKACESPYLGANSIPTILRNHASEVGSAGTRQGVEDAILPIMGLRTTVSIDPFPSPLEASQQSVISQIYRAVPPDRDITR